MESDPFGPKLIKLLGPLKNKLKSKSVSKGESLLTVGSSSSHAIWVESGLLCVSLVSESGQEVVKQFAKSAEFTGPYSDYLRKQPSQISIKAIINSEVLIIAFEDIENVCLQNKELERFRRIFLEKNFLQKDERIVQLLTQDASTRYSIFLKSFSDVHSTIPDFMIASYLNITPSYLSTLKSRLS
jgi:CRP-like cAMP-binding protein